MPSPEAVLLDVGGIFHLPSHSHVLGACTRAGFDAQVDRLDRAHYRGTTAFHTDYTGELPWSDMWDGYLAAYATELDVSDTLRADVLEHLHAEFAVAAIWSRVVPGSIDDLRVLEATGGAEASGPMAGRTMPGSSPAIRCRSVRTKAWNWGSYAVNREDWTITISDA